MAFVNDNSHTLFVQLVTSGKTLVQYQLPHFHTSTKMTPVEALYGYLPPKMLDYVLGTTQVAIIN